MRPAFLMTSTMAATSSPSSACTGSRIWFVLNTPICHSAVLNAHAGAEADGGLHDAREEHEASQVILHSLTPVPISRLSGLPLLHVAVGVKVGQARHVPSAPARYAPSTSTSWPVSSCSGWPASSFSSTSQRKLTSSPEESFTPCSTPCLPRRTSMVGSSFVCTHTGRS